MTTSPSSPGPALLERIPVGSELDGDTLLERFVEHTSASGVTLYPAQEEAILSLFTGEHVILNTPTGSGKSLVALALHAKTLSARDGRTFYTAPIKALVSEKFFALCRELGAENVGLLTGDASVNADARVICCTAEILVNYALRDGDDTDIDTVAMDEFHFYGDRDRGVAWQIPLLTMKKTQFLLMSATMGKVQFFADDLLEKTGRSVAIVQSKERPVPLDYAYRETPLHETIAELLASDRAPVYIVHFTQRAAAELAQDLMSIEVVSKERKARIKDACQGFRWDTPFGKDLKRFVMHGVGVHHAGLLPKYRLLIEKLANRGLLAIICGTDTLGVGVNVPIRSVLFTQLCKYDGKKTQVLSVRDFQQISGRAGRKGFDDRGTVIAQAPEHMVENRTARMKAEGDPKKMKKLVLRKPPEKGYAHWDESTFQRLIESDPETLESQFKISHGLILSVLEGAYERRENGCRALGGLIRASHEPRRLRFQHGRQAIRLFRSLLSAKLLEPFVEDDGSKTVRVQHDLQEDFSLHYALSMFVVEVARRLDPESPDFALDLLTLVEATIEDPDAVLFRQLDALKGERLRELKAEGVEYDERMAELEKVDIPRPRLDLLVSELELFAEKHPWVARGDLRPKSVARDMFERGASFNEYVNELGLERAEGLLLRYLSEAYKGLSQTIPEALKTDAVLDLEDWLLTVIRQVDSSLVDEWTKLASGNVVMAQPTDDIVDDTDITKNARGFTVMVRNAVFRVVQLLARGYVERALELVSPESAPSPRDVEALLEQHRAEHGVMRADVEARSPKHLRIERHESGLDIEQTLLDANELDDWQLELGVSFAKSREAVVFEWRRLGPIGR